MYQVQKSTVWEKVQNKYSGKVQRSIPLQFVIHVKSILKGHK